MGYLSIAACMLACLIAAIHVPYRERRSLLPALPFLVVGLLLGALNAFTLM